ncbi:Tyrosine-protein kinase abl1 [Balamuthia mandrillaris]
MLALHNGTFSVFCLFWSVCLALLLASGAEGQSVLVVSHACPPCKTDLQLHLQDQFDVVDAVMLLAVMPPREVLFSYDAILVIFTLFDNPPPSSELKEEFGQLLAEFVEQGGGVVMSWCSFLPQYVPGPAFMDKYAVILPEFADQKTGWAYLGEKLVPDHPTVANINSFDGLFMSWRTSIMSNNTEAMAEGSYVTAEWDDGTVLVAVRDDLGPAKARRVDLGFMAISSDFDKNMFFYFWNSSTQGADLMGNALRYSMSGCLGYLGPARLEITQCSPAQTVESEGDVALPDFTSTLQYSGGCYSVLVTQTPASDAMMEPGEHSVVLQVEDEAGIVQQCTTTFTVAPPLGGSDSLARDASGEDSQESLALGLGIGLPLGILLLLAIVLIVAFLVWRNGKKKRLAATKEDLEDGARETYGASPMKGKKKSKSSKAGGKGKGAFNWNIEFSELTFGEEIGRGAFGLVRKGEWRGTSVAIKQILAEHNEELEQMRSEIEIMQNLRPHGNVLLLLGICEDESANHYVVTEFMGRGDLRHFLMSSEGQSMVDHQMMLKMAKEIAVGLSHLHSEGITHRDLSARNLLLANNLTIKISDFGLSRLKKDPQAEEQTTASEVGPLKWMAPESISSRTYSHKSDVWSYGVVLWEIANFGEEPYPGLTPVQVALQVTKGSTPEMPENIPEVLRDIMKACWQFDPKDRPTMEEVVAMLEEEGEASSD